MIMMSGNVIVGILGEGNIILKIVDVVLRNRKSSKES